MTPFEIRNYKPIKVKSLRGTFTLVISPDNLQFCVYNCNYVVTAEKSFWTFPSREYTKNTGEQAYFTLFKIGNKTISSELEASVLKQLQEIDKEAYASDQKREGTVQADASDLPF